MKTNQFLISSFLLLITCMTSTIATIAQSVSAGSLHSVFLCSDSIPRACGTNVTGQLGVGSGISFRSVPTQVVGLTQITEISAAANMSLFLKVDGTVWACGDNQYGELGNDTFEPQYVPTQIASLSNIIAVSTGGGHSLFLKDDGTVWACGNNQVGQLGDGTNDNRSTPVQVSSLTDIIAVSAGFTHSLFLKNDGTVYLCGFFAAQNTPVLIPSLSDVAKISAGEHYSLFLKNDGTAMGLGSNPYGELGDGTTDGATTPVAVTVVTGITALKAGPGISFFLKSDGTVWMCGKNSSGQFGIGTNTGWDPHPTPVQHPDLSDIVALTTGSYHSIFVKDDETAQSSGGNSQGMLGNGSTNNSWSLVPVTNMCSFSTSGIIENNNMSSVSVFPNPSNGSFVLSFDNTELAYEKLEIYNPLGEQVYTTSTINQQMHIDLNNQSKGIYFIKLENGLGIYTQKIILQ